MNNLLLEMIKIRSIMGFNQKITENFLKENLLLTEGTVFGDGMAIIKSIVKKTTQNLTEEEVIYLRQIIDDFNYKYGDEFGEINFEGKMTDNVRSGLQKLMSQSNDEIVNFFGNVIKRVESQNLANRVLVITPEQALADALSRKTPYMLMGGEEATLMDFLRYAYSVGGVNNIDMPAEFLQGLKFELLGARSVVDVGDPWSRYLNDVYDQIDEVLGEKTTLIPEEDVKTIIDEIPNIKTSLDNPVKPIEIEPIEIDLSGVGVEESLEEFLPSQTVKEAMENLKNTFMKRMKETCNSSFCVTMKNYYETDPKKFQDMWNLMFKKIEDEVKIKQGGDNLISVDDFTKIEALNKYFQEKNVPLTREQYLKIGESVYESWKKAGFAANFSPWSALDITKKEWYIMTGRMILGRNYYTGARLSRGELIKKWAYINSFFIVWHGAATAYQLMFGDPNDPTATTEDILAEFAGEIVGDLASFVGGPIIWRVGIEAAYAVGTTFLPESSYVNQEDLIEYIQKDAKSKGKTMTELQIRDNILPFVTYDTESEFESTQIAGITDPDYSYYNGTYTMDKVSEFRYEINFIPKGSKAPVKTKTIKIPKDIIDNIEYTIATKSALSNFIATKGKVGSALTTKDHNKKIDDVETKQMTDSDGNDYEVIIYEWTDSFDKKNKFAFNYTMYTNENAPDLTNADNWNKLVKEVPN